MCAQSGLVHRVQDNAREHIFDGIVVKTDTGSVFVDAPEVARITLRQVSLNIDFAEVSLLPEHRAKVGALEAKLKRWKRRFGG